MDTFENRQSLERAVQLLSTAMFLYAKLSTQQVCSQNAANGLEIVQQAFTFLDSIHLPSPPKRPAKKATNRNANYLPCAFQEQKRVVTELATNLHVLYSAHTDAAGQ